jgi:hypothetical protein
MGGKECRRHTYQSFQGIQDGARDVGGVKVAQGVKVSTKKSSTCSAYWTRKPARRGRLMVDTAGLNLAHDKKIQSIYNRKPSVLKVTRPGKNGGG